MSGFIDKGPIVSGGEDMTSSLVARPAAAEEDAELAVMARNGIARVSVSQYEVDGFRYGNLADALAQVSRGAAGRGRPS